MLEIDEVVQDIEEKVADLLRERSYLLEEEGIYEKYVVFDVALGKVTSNLVVLSPIEDKEKLEALSDMTGDEEMKQWVRDFNEDSCDIYCSIFGTPKCCRVCQKTGFCEEELIRCESVICKRKDSKDE